MKKLTKLADLAPHEAALQPVYARRGLTEPIPKYELPDGEMEPRSAYDLIHDELMLDDLLTFVVNV